VQPLSAELRLTVLKARGQGNITLMGLAPPRQQVSPPGLSDTLDRDGGLDHRPGVWLRERFENPSLAQSWSGGLNTLAIVADGAPPIDGKALRVTVPRGVHTGLQKQITLAALNGGKEPEEAYFRYHLWLDGSWDPYIDGGKMPGFAGTYGQAGWGGRAVDGNNGWSARGAFMRADPGDAGRGIGSYVYTAAPNERSGAIWGWNLGPTGWLPKGRWVAVEQHLRLNTPGRPDGVLRAWIDGQLAFEKRDIHWRDSATLKIETLWMNVYHGGSATPDRELVLYIDNLVIADRYIGPGRFPPWR